MPIRWTNSNSNNNTRRPAYAGAGRGRRRVAFSDAVAVHALPPANRGLEPGYKARMKRRAALRNYHDVTVGLSGVNRWFGEGNGSTPGRTASYTDAMRKKNKLHMQKYGLPFYTYTPARDGQGRFTGKVLGGALNRFRPARRPAPNKY